MAKRGKVLLGRGMDVGSQKYVNVCSSPSSPSPACLSTEALHKALLSDPTLCVSSELHRPVLVPLTDSLSCTPDIDYHVLLFS